MRYTKRGLHQNTIIYYQKNCNHDSYFLYHIRVQQQYAYMYNIDLFHV